MRIPRLEDLTLNQRAVLTIAIVVIVIILLGVVGFLTSRWEAQSQSLAMTLPPSKWDAHLIELDKQALDDAYKEKIKLLFSVWVREYDTSMPERPMKGATQTKRAYQDAMKAIEFREQRLREQPINERK